MAKLVNMPMRYFKRVLAKDHAMNVREFDLIFRQGMTPLALRCAVNESKRHKEAFNSSLKRGRDKASVIHG